MTLTARLRPLWGLCALLLCAASTRQGSLDNTAWKVRAVPDKQAAAEGAVTFQEELVFREGKVLAIGWVSKGFEAAEYRMEEGAAGRSWSARLAGPEGDARWQGVSSAEGITGTLIWSKADGRVHQYTFAGKRRRG